MNACSMMDSLKIGKKFSSFEQFDTFFENYKSQKFTDFSIVDSKTLDRIKKMFSSPRIQNAPPELKYYYIKYTCVHGGLCKEKVTNKRERNRFSMKTNCPALITLKLSCDGKHLVIVNLNDKHNHVVSRDLFKSLRSQRKLDPKEQEEIIKLLELKANKKLVQKKYSALTQKNITLKDLTNLAARAKARNVKVVPQPSGPTSQTLGKAEETLKQISISKDVEVVAQPSEPTSQKFREAQVSPKQISKSKDVEVVAQPIDLTTLQKVRKAQISPKQISKSRNVKVVPRPRHLTTFQKLRKAQVLTSKLAMLMSESPFFQEKLSFLQTLYNSWAKKVSLEIRSKYPADPSPPTPPESFSGIIPNRSVTEYSSGLEIERRDNASVSSPLTNTNAASSYSESPSRVQVKDLNRRVLNAYWPAVANVGMRETSMGAETVSDPTPSSASHYPMIVNLCHKDSTNQPTNDCEIIIQKQQ